MFSTLKYILIERYLTLSPRWVPAINAPPRAACRRVPSYERLAFFVLPTCSFKILDFVETEDLRMYWIKGMLLRPRSVF